MLGGVVNKLFKPNIDKMKAIWDVDGLIEALSHRDHKIRKKCCEAFAEMRVREAIDPLIKALSDENSEVRKTAAYALGKIGDERTVKPLIEALKDESMDVRLEAAKSLKRIGYTKIKGLEDILMDILRNSREEIVNKTVKRGFKIPFFRWR